MLNQIRRFLDFFRHTLWDKEPLGALGYIFQGVRVIILAVHGLWCHRAWLQAATLAYATMLALIPLMALLFAILKGLGLQRLLASHIMDRLAPGAHDFAVQVLNYIEGTQVTSLGVFGVVFLLGALVILMSNVERAFNQTWQIPQTRSWRRKLSDYLSIFLLLPILMAVAISLSSGILSQPDIRRFLTGILPGSFYSYTSGLASLALLWLAFTFIYAVMPNTRVFASSALVGGVVGGTLWQVAHYIFAWFQAAATYYNAIYGALYHLLFLVLWMFWSWLVVLYGTEVSYAYQHLDRLTRQWRHPAQPLETVDEYLGLAILAAIGQRWQEQQPLLSLSELSHLLAGTDSLARRVVQALKSCALIMEIPAVEPWESTRFLPARPLEQMNVQQVLTCLRQARGTALAHLLPEDSELRTLIKNLLNPSPSPSLDGMTLKDLAAQLTTRSLCLRQQNGNPGQNTP